MDALAKATQDSKITHFHPVRVRPYGLSVVPGQPGGIEDHDWILGSSIHDPTVKNSALN
jgi:hypothetical protein